MPSSATQNMIGTHTITDGRTPDGRAYQGTMQVTPRGMFLTTQADLGPLGVRHGLMMSFGRRVVMAFGPKDKVEIGAYRIAGAHMVGLWVPPEATDLATCGHEPSTRNAAGDWVIANALAIDNQPYHGTLRITPQGDPARRPTPVGMTWSLHDGEYKSFGLACDDALFSTFNFEPGTPHGLAVYQAGDDGILRGTLIVDGDLRLGCETLIPAHARPYTDRQTA